MTGAEAALLAGVAFVASAVNGVVGGGTLLTFGALTALGVPPVIANGTSTTGVSLGSFASAWAYRRELRGRRLRLAIAATIVMAAVGATLVIALPDEVFASVVPWLILSAVALVALQPAITRTLGDRDGSAVQGSDLPLWTGLIGVYGGYFGAGQGVMYMAALGARYDTRPQHANAAKNLLSASANLTAGVVFIAGGAIAPAYAAAIAVGAITGGYLGGRVARRLPDVGLRAVVIAVGIGAALLTALS